MNNNLMLCCGKDNYKYREKEIRRLAHVLENEHFIHRQMRRYEEMDLNRDASTASFVKSAGSVSPDTMVIFPIEGKKLGKIFVNKQSNASDTLQLEKLWMIVLLGPSFFC